MLRRTKVMAVPTGSWPIPTGSSVALEASASGCCVVATDTPAMADYIATATQVCSSRRVTWPAGEMSSSALARRRPASSDLGRGARRAVEERYNAPAHVA